MDICGNGADKHSFLQFLLFYRYFHDVHFRRRNTALHRSRVCNDTVCGDIQGEDNRTQNGGNGSYNGISWSSGNSAVVSVTPSGVLYGLGSALGYAMYSIFNRAAIDRGYKPFAVTAWGFGFAALFSVLFADMGAIGEMISLRPSMVGFAVLFAAVTSAAPYILYSAGLKYTETGKAAIYSSIEPAAAAVFGMIFCNEKLTIPAVWGLL